MGWPAEEALWVATVERAALVEEAAVAAEAQREAVMAVAADH